MDAQQVILSQAIVIAEKVAAIDAVTAQAKEALAAASAKIEEHEATIAKLEQELATIIANENLKAVERAAPEEFEDGIVTNRIDSNGKVPKNDLPLKANQLGEPEAGA